MDNMNGEPVTKHEAYYEPSNSSSLTTTIIDGVSEVKDTPVDDLQPLQYSIDVDSLEELFRPLSSGGFASVGELQFMYEGCSIYLHSTGAIQISDFSDDY